MLKIQSEQKESGTMTEIPVLGFDHIELYVGNARQARFFYERGLAFEVVGYRGLETGDRQTTSYVVQQNGIKFVLTSTMSPGHEVSAHVAEHGDGVKVIALRVEDATKCYRIALERGVIGVEEPTIATDDYGRFVSASVKTYGDTIHKFVERGSYRGNFAPGYKPLNSWSGGAGLTTVDHVVGNVQKDCMSDWVDYYKDVFGFHVYQGFDPSDISTQYSALSSRVMANLSGTIKMPINQPAEGERKSQIQEYIDFYNGPGVQHVALATSDIVATVSELKKRGIEFLSAPRTYYKNVAERVGAIDEDMNELANLGILIDRESEGYLLQIFTRPVEDRPTLFFEIIQRKNGATGFGKGNFMALFESIEREQVLRGNL